MVEEPNVRSWGAGGFAWCFGVLHVGIYCLFVYYKSSIYLVPSPRIFGQQPSLGSEFGFSNSGFGFALTLSECPLCFSEEVFTACSNRK
jgi:hypothetical protein